MRNPIADAKRSLAALPRIWKVQFLFAGAIGAIAWGMLGHPIVAIAWYLIFTLVFTSIVKASTTDEAV